MVNGLCLRLVHDLVNDILFVCVCVNVTHDSVSVCLASLELEESLIVLERRI